MLIFLLFSLCDYGRGIRKMSVGELYTDLRLGVTTNIKAIEATALVQFCSNRHVFTLYTDVTKKAVLCLL